MVFDFISAEEASLISKHGALTPLPMPEQGTALALNGSDFESYLQGLKRDVRQSQRRSYRRLNEMGVKISTHDTVRNIKEALTLINRHDKQYRATSFSWRAGMLAHLEMVDSVWLTASKDEKLVGCGLLLGDKGEWFATALGRDYDYRYVYFVLGFESIKYLIAKHAKAFRWGTGAYDYKARLGFALENNNFVAFQARNQLIDKLFRYLGPKLV